MMIGTVMLTNASSAPTSNHNPEHVTAISNSTLAQNMDKFVNGQQQYHSVVGGGVNTISQMVHSASAAVPTTMGVGTINQSKSYNVHDTSSNNNYMSDNESTRGGGGGGGGGHHHRSNTNNSHYYSSNTAGRSRNTNSHNGHKSYDQQSIGSSSIVTNTNQTRPSSKLGIIRPNNYQVHDMHSRSVNFGANNTPSTHDDKTVCDKTAQTIYDKIKDTTLPNTHHHHHIYESSSSNTQQHPPKIQVEILPQDDNWGENGNTTALTYGGGDNFSDFNDDQTEDGRSVNFTQNRKYNSNEEGFDGESTAKSLLRQHASYVCILLTCACSFLTPVLFIVLPRLNLTHAATGSGEWQVDECGLECEGLLIGIAFKMCILLLGNWAMFARRSRASMPRVYELRALCVLLLCIVTFSFWLFYGVRIIQANVRDYFKILQFTVSYVDVLLFVFIVSVFVLELRQLKPQYVVKVMRSPDGEQHVYNMGDMSIQRAAVWILDQYYKDFMVFNPWLESVYKKSRQAPHLMQIEQNEQRSHGNNSLRKKEKLNEANDAINNDNKSIKSMKSIKSKKASAASLSARINQSANERFYEEYEQERKLRKRRARLVISTEEAFTHIKRLQHGEHHLDIDEQATSQMGENDSKKPSPSMDPFEAAQAVFTTIARDLRRYLRATRQQPFFTRDSIVAHLANCISYDMSPKVFLQRYLTPEAAIFNERAMLNRENRNNLNESGEQKHTTVSSHGINYSLNLKTPDQPWILICDNSLYQNIEDNLMIVLKQDEVTLMCTFKRLPRFSLIEDILDPKRNKFTLRLNSETTV